MADPSTDPQNLATVIGEVSERVTVLVREEIELAKVEMTAKGKSLARGAVVAVVAGVFLLFALLSALEGAAWLLWYVLPTGGSPNFFFGFFALAVILVVLGALGGLIAFRAVRAGSPPTPSMAIDEARKIRQAVGSGSDGAG